jgi:hypothetical protein
MATKIHALLILQRQHPEVVTELCAPNAQATSSSGMPSTDSSDPGSSSSSSSSPGRASASSSRASDKATSCSDSSAAAMPASHNTLLSLLGCDGVLLLLLAASKTEQLRNATLLRAQQRDLACAVKIYEHLAAHTVQQARLGLHTMQQQEQSTHFLLPSLLLHFAAEQTKQLAHEQYRWDYLPSTSAQAFRTARCGDASYQPGFADVQQVLLQDLVPMVVQVSSAVLGLPGPAAYRSSYSSDMQSSTPAPLCMHLAAPKKYHMALHLVECVSCAAPPCCSTGSLAVPVAALGSHVLVVEQLFEAALRQTHIAHNSQLSGKTLARLDDGLCPFWFVCSSECGAFLEVAGIAAAADAACISSEHARLQFASLCCSVLKAAAAAAGTPGADEVCLTVATALTEVVAGLTGSSILDGWRIEFTAASGVSWLAISGRVLLYLAARLQGAASDASTAPADAGDSAGQADLAGAAAVHDAVVPIVLEEGLQDVSLILCQDLHSLLLTAPVTQQLSAAGYDVEGLQPQLEAFLQSLPADVETVYLSEEQVVALRSLGYTLNNLAFPCACNNPACSQLAGPLELQLVNGPSCMCAGCLVAHYCCRDCQRRHWKQHKPVCHAIAAAQAGMSAT